MILHDSTLILARPEAVFRFFDEMETHYLAWHPDHVRFRWERGHGVALGNVFFFEERIAGKLFKKRVTFTHVVPNQHLEFALIFVIAVMDGVNYTGRVGGMWTVYAPQAPSLQRRTCMNTSGTSHSDQTRSLDPKYGKIENNLCCNRRTQDDTTISFCSPRAICAVVQEEDKEGNDGANSYSDRR